MRRAEGPPRPAELLTLTELRSKSFLATVFWVVCYTPIDTLQDQGEISEIRPGGEKKQKTWRRCHKFLLDWSLVTHHKNVNSVTGSPACETHI